MHHPRADVEHLNILDKNGGRDLIQLEMTCKTIIIGFKKYFDTTTDWMLYLVNTREAKEKNILLVKCKYFANQLDLTK